MTFGNCIHLYHHHDTQDTEHCFSFGGWWTFELFLLLIIMELMMIFGLYLCIVAYPLVILQENSSLGALIGLLLS